MERLYEKKKENDKKRKEKEKEKRIKDRKDKKMLKEKMILEKKKQQKRKNWFIRQQDSSSGEDVIEIQYAESGDSLETPLDSYAESGKSDSENEPLSKMASNKKAKCKMSPKITNGSYVIVKYEGEYFPGRIENKEADLYEISTMVLSVGNSFRWPDKTDMIWYRKEDIIEKNCDPLLLNKRGFYKIPEMEKYLSDIYMI